MSEKRLFFGGTFVAISEAARKERRHRQRVRLYQILFGAAVIVVAGLGVAAIGELLAS